MDDDEKVLRWKWEFMRRNLEYRADYEKLKKRRQEIDYDHLIKQIAKDEAQWKKDHPSNINDVSLTVAAFGKCEEWLRTKRKKEFEIIISFEKEEMEYSNKWSSGWLGKMYDPDKSFEEITDSKSNEKDMNKWMNNHLSRWAFVKGLGSGAVNRIRYLTLADGNIGFKTLNIEPGDYLLKINFKKANSIGALKKLVCDMLDEQYAVEKSLQNSSKIAIARDDGIIELKFEEGIKYHPKKGQQNKKDYDLILRIGSLKEEGKTNEDVAKIIYPRVFKATDDDIAEPDSKIRMISNYYKTYKILVSGGYKKISIT